MERMLFYFMEMKKVYKVTIVCANEKDKTYEYEEYCDEKMDMVRLIMSFKPKRNFEIVSIEAHQCLQIK